MNLKFYLTANASFSGLSGLILQFFSENIQTIFGFNNNLVLPIIGANLLIFSLFVFYVSNWQIQNKPLVYLITVLDLLWVIGSILIVSLQLFDLSDIAYLVIGGVGIWIGYLAYQQFRNINTEI